jgi:hypothetical protein
MSRTLVRLVVIAACLFTAVAFAQSQPPEIVRRVTWPTTPAHVDGSLADEATFSALPLQLIDNRWIHRDPA